MRRDLAVVGATRLERRAYGVVAAALIAAVAIAGCGRGSHATRTSSTPAAAPWSSAACKRQAQSIADESLQILYHYGAGAAYPADVGYFGFRTTLSGFKHHGCRPAVLGDTLARRLTREQRTELLSHLPSAMVRYIRRTLPPRGG